MASDNIASSQHPSGSHQQTLPATPPGPIPPSATRVVPLTGRTIEIARQQHAILDSLLEQAIQDREIGRGQERRRDRSLGLPPRHGSRRHKDSLRENCRNEESRRDRSRDTREMYHDSRYECPREHVQRDKSLDPRPTRPSAFERLGEQDRQIGERSSCVQTSGAVTRRQGVQGCALSEGAAVRS